MALYDYWFTDEAERRKTGAIWNRRFERLYLPSISLMRCVSELAADALKLLMTTPFKPRST